MFFGENRPEAKAKPNIFNNLPTKPAPKSPQICPITANPSQGLIRAIEKLDAKLTAETEKVRSEVAVLKAHVTSEVQAAKNDTIKWVIGSMLTTMGVTLGVVYMLLRAMLTTP
ncbi:MAG: hypothetical protein R3C70_07040 [Geminicoccaceae bacterium]